MNSSPNTGLPYLEANQAQKHVTLNETLRRLDAIVQLVVESTTEANQPATANEGQRWILQDAVTGDDWSGFSAGSIAAFQDGAWQEIQPGEGWLAWSIEDQTLLVFDGMSWSPSDASTAASFGINTPADTTNRLSVKSDSVLLSHDDVTPGSGDVRLIANKDAVSDTASLVFQTGFSGRAEFGLAGDDDFHIKVSPDGSAWREAFKVESGSSFSIFDGHLAIAREAPSDLWLNAGGLFGPQGMIGSNGSFGYGFWYNGYRNTSGGWTSQSVNGSDVAAAFELQKTACLIRFEDSPSAAVPEIRVMIDAAGMSPGSDDAITLGAASNRWSQVYAASSTISTSDGRGKQIEGTLEAAEKRAARRILDRVVKYRCKAAIARKGNGARIHIGVTAQDVKSAFEAEGLDAERYGIWCEDALVAYRDDPENGVQASPTGETRLGLRYEELIMFLLPALL